MIMQYLRKKTGKNVSLRDFDNMVARMRGKRRVCGSTEDRLKAVLREMCECRAFVDDSKTAQVITLQTRQMRRWFKVFPDVVLVDATHNTNESRYKLFSFMVNDAYGHGQYVHHSLMENESAECMRDSISPFKFNNPSWTRIKVMVINKDLGELSLLESEFPGVRLILCHFHLEKYIRTEMSKSEYDEPSSFDKYQVEEAVYLMRLASSEAKYTTYLKYMYFLLDGVHLKTEDLLPEPENPFLRYFTRNWDSMKECWALYAWSDLPHLGNHTNNRYVYRLESSWGHIKEILKAEMTLDECVVTLMFLQAVAEMEYAKNIIDVWQMRFTGADEELEALAREVALSLIGFRKPDRQTHYAVEELQSNLFILTGNDNQTLYHDNTAVYRCSCVHENDAFTMPTRHVLAPDARKACHSNSPTCNHVGSCRFNLPAAEEDAPDKTIACTAFQIGDSTMSARRRQVLNGTIKYKHALESGKSIANIMSRNGTAVFGAIMVLLK
ncbi:LOW QUALITY PROTEIN: hypothetical protein PHMEG_0004195 [Phytophthora megakarya]|uniref:ZSWIM1/3 RNaseH-like domain-containing protein n=1 Tax=Phytophthora megakarya TaxID=4795 RepID=A0A225WUI8_9STRA|nr:LOW QUALITY PROTEIN: hypothetical protein PHMEG_0004195 [Phytophthora megakarya]